MGEKVGFTNCVLKSCVFFFFWKHDFLAFSENTAVAIQKLYEKKQKLYEK